MEKREKVEFILEQIRLCLAKKDYIRTQIISKKISTKFFEEKDTDVSLTIFKSFCFPFTRLRTVNACWYLLVCVDWAWILNFEFTYRLKNFAGTEAEVLWANDSVGSAREWISKNLQTFQSYLWHE